MKRLAALLFILILFNQAYAQKRMPESVKVIGLYTTAIVLNAVGDGLNDSGSKTWGHTCNAVSIGSLLMSPVLLDMNKDNWGYYLLSYVSLRISFFDYTYNATRGLGLDYIGNSSLSDKFLQGTKPPPQFILFGRSLTFIVGISTPITKLDHKQIKCTLNKNRNYKK